MIGAQDLPRPRGITLIGYLTPPHACADALLAPTSNLLTAALHFLHSLVNADPTLANGSYPY